MRSTTRARTGFIVGAAVGLLTVTGLALAQEADPPPEDVPPVHTPEDVPPPAEDPPSVDEIVEEQIEELTEDAGRPPWADHYAPDWQPGDPPPWAGPDGGKPPWVPGPPPWAGAHDPEGGPPHHDFPEWEPGSGKPPWAGLEDTTPGTGG